MEIILCIVAIVAMMVAVGYSVLVTTGYNNFRGINLQLDDMYKSTDEMAFEVYEQLKSKGKECEILETGKEYPKFLINGKKYIMIHKIASMSGFPVQAIQLKICKE
ncbi:MAG: hypothetical protein N2B06_06020 [Clostridium sp.]